MFHLTFTIYALFITFSLPKLYQTRSFPQGSNRQDLPTVFKGISKITKSNNKINHIDLSFNITTPSFNFTFSQIKFIPLFSNASKPLYSQEVISISNHTIAFFFDLFSEIGVYRGVSHQHNHSACHPERSAAESNA